MGNDRILSRKQKSNKGPMPAEDLEEILDRVRRIAARTTKGYFLIGEVLEEQNVDDERGVGIGLMVRNSLFAHDFDVRLIARNLMKSMDIPVEAKAELLMELAEGLKDEIE